MILNNTYSGHDDEDLDAPVFGGGSGGGGSAMSSHAGGFVSPISRGWQAPAASTTAMAI